MVQFRLLMLCLIHFWFTIADAWLLPRLGHCSSAKERKAVLGPHREACKPVWWPPLFNASAATMQQLLQHR